MEPNRRVEHALALVPRTAEFQPLIDAIIGASSSETARRWSKSGTYATIPKRLLNPEVLQHRANAAVEHTRVRMEQQMRLVVRAIRAYQDDDLTGAAAAFLRAGEHEEEMDCLEGARRCFVLALDALGLRQTRGLRARILRRLGGIAQAAEHYSEAHGWFLQAYQESVVQGDGPGQVAACLGLGRVYATRGQTEQAREWYARAMSRARRLGSAYQWPVRLEIASLAIRCGRLAEAESHLRRARAGVHRMGDERMMLEWHRCQCALLRDQGDAVGAERMCSDALARELAPRCQLQLRLELSRCLLQQGRLMEARDQLRVAEELAAREQLVPMLVDVYELLGATARERCDEEGFVFFEEALEICREQRLPRSRLAAVHHAYGLFLCDCTRPGEAKAHLERSYVLYRELGLAAECREVEAALRT